MKEEGISRTRRAFTVVVCVAAAMSIVVGAGASPPRNIPTYALDSFVVYKCEIALTLFLGGYLFVATITLAIEGRTVGKISTGGIELPAELSSSASHQQTLIDMQERLQQDLIERDERFSRRVDRLADELERAKSVRGPAKR